MNTTWKSVIVIGGSGWLILTVTVLVLLSQRVDILESRMLEVEHGLRQANIAAVNYDAATVAPLKDRVAALEGKVKTLMPEPDLVAMEVNEQHLLSLQLRDWQPQDWEIFLIMMQERSNYCDIDGGGVGHIDCIDGVYAPSQESGKSCFVPDEAFLIMGWEEAVSRVCEP